MNTDLHNNNEKIEIEAKFVCPEELGWDALLDVVTALGFHYTREKPYLQSDAYFDTPHYTLLNSNVALRIRQRGESYVGACKWTTKQQDSIFERKEFEWILSGDEVKLWNEQKKPAIPPTIIDAQNLHGQSLRKVLVVETQRYTAIIHGNEGFKTELSLDEVTFRGHKGQKQYREIEVELLSGRFEQIKQLTDNLQSRLKLQPAVDSKYKKGMMLVGKYGVKAP